MSAVAARPLRSTDRVGAVLTLFLALNAVITVVSGVAQVGERQVLERFHRRDPVTAGEIVDAIDRSELIGEIGLWLFVVTAIVWLLWQHRAHANLHAARVEALGSRPLWTVG